MALLENLFNQFGWNHKKPYEPVEDVQDKNKSFQPPIYDDGAVIIQSSSVHGAYLDVSMGVTSEAMLVARYREMALQPEVDAAIEDVVKKYSANFNIGEHSLELSLADLFIFSVSINTSGLSNLNSI